LPAVVSHSELPREADRVAILVNPKAGPKAAMPWADRLYQRLQREGFKTEVFTDLAAAAERANRWHDQGCLRTLVAAGGDGTAAEVVNRTTEGVPITLLPTGNANLLARYFHLSRNAESLCRTIVEGVAARVDAGLANGRIFLIVAGCGFDAEVVRRVHANRMGHINIGTYLKPIVEILGSYEYPEIRLHWEECDGADLPQSVRWLFVFNLPCYGGGFRIAPQASGGDGLLDVCSFRRGGFWRGLGYFAAIVTGQHRRLSDCTACRVRRLRIVSDVEVPYELDGDIGGVLPLDIEVLPGRMTLVVPKEVIGD
jgi:diacylglycerol kinase (ATP)